MPSKRYGWRSQVFAVVITLVSRILMARDTLFGLVQGLARSPRQQEFTFPSGDRSLAAAWVPGAPGGPVVLLCHGIGETGAHWTAVQAYFAEQGVGSMFFNYSGYGRSSGTIRAEHCDQDFFAAYGELRRRVGPDAAVFVLGFSLGSGIAANGVRSLRPPAAGLILCEAYTSFRDAVCATGAPRFVALGFPDIWNTVAIAPSLKMPVLVAHSDADHLFPLAMAQRNAAAFGGRAQLFIAKGVAHNQPYRKPGDAYWAPVIEWIFQSKK
jgi:uncharacterized protein